MDMNKKSVLVDALIDEFLKEDPNEEDVKELMQKLEINYYDDRMANMNAILHSIDFKESIEGEASQ